MSSTLDKIKALAKENTSNWVEEATKRQEDKTWTDRSKRIAVCILREIRTQKDMNGMTQKKLADAMGVSPQYINKVVKGKENLTLETIAKIEAVLGIRLLEIPRMEQVSRITVSYHTERVVVDKNKSKKVVGKTIPLYPQNPFTKTEGTNG